MGSPQNSNRAQIAQLEKAGQLQTAGAKKMLDVKNGTIDIDIALPRQGVALLMLTW